MANIRRLVLDVMKPHEPSILDFTTNLADLEGVDGSNSSIMEIDREVENIKVVIKGEDIVYSKVKQVIGELGGSFHYIDRVVCGQEMIEDIKTPQD